MCQRMARCTLRAYLGVALLLCSALAVSALDKVDSKDVSLLEAQTATSVRSQLQVAHKRSTVSATHKATAAVAATVKGDVSQPWDFLATGTSLTMTWIAFSILIVLTCGLGAVLGCLLRTYCGDAKSKTFDIETSAHSIYNS